MRNVLQTPFWRGAYESLPEAIRGRYLAQIQSAERWGLAIDAVIENLARVRRSLSGLTTAPAKTRSAH